MGISGTSGQSQEPGAPCFADDGNRAIIYRAPALGQAGPAFPAVHLTRRIHSREETQAPGQRAAWLSGSKTPTRLQLESGRDGACDLFQAPARSRPSRVLTVSSRSGGVRKPCLSPEGTVPWRRVRKRDLAPCGVPRHHAGLFTHLREPSWGKCRVGQASAEHGVCLPLGEGRRVNPGRENREGAQLGLWDHSPCWERAEKAPPCPSPS